jgi:hypothetical protein
VVVAVAVEAETVEAEAGVVEAVSERYAVLLVVLQDGKTRQRRGPI